MLRTSLLAPLVLLSACAKEPGCLDCVLSDANNYGIASTLDAEVFAVEAENDVVLDWSALHHDVMGQALDPTEVDRVLLVAFLGLEPAEIAEGLATDSLNQRDATLFVACSPEGETSCALSDFSVLGSTLDVEKVFLADEGTWLAAFTTTGRAGGRSFAFLQATTVSREHEVLIDDQTANLEVDVDLLSLEPRRVAPGAEVVIDWSEVGHDGLGNPLKVSSLDQLQVARYDASPEELESRIFELETLAVERWTLDLNGETSALLSDLEGPRPFPGVDDGSTWLMALTCSGCTHPAPRILTLFEAGSMPETP